MRYFSITILQVFMFAYSGIHTAWAQTRTITTEDLNNGQNSITTAVPFLLICPDSRAGGMGEAGAAMPNDVNAMHWNLAKAPFNEKKGALSISYTPWLRVLVPDISLSYLCGYYKISEQSAISGSLRFFSLGEIQFTDQTGNSTGIWNPNEFALDAGYATKLSENFSLGVSFRYIYSNLAGGFNQTSTGSGIEPGVSYAGNISAYYKNKTKIKYQGANYKVDYGIGAVISNIGSKITYSSAQYENFIPINLRLGTYANVEIDKYNSIALLFDINKLMVPTNPYYLKGSDGRTDSIYNNEKVIVKGMNPNVPVVQGMVQSFYDAPGGASEELKEINISAGIEYWYEKQFALRAGYFHEPFEKGNRRYLTMGMGLRYNVFGLDVAYLWPFQQRHPLENTLRFTLIFDFDAFVQQKDDAPNKK